MDMAGKTVLITGSTDGVGRHVATQLAAAGATVLIHGRDTLRAEVLVDEIVRAGYPAPTFYQADLAMLAGVRRLADAVLADHGKLDVFVSNAGIIEWEPVTKITLECWNRILGVNLTGAMLCARETAKHMVGRRKGVMLFTSSTIHRSTCSRSSSGVLISPSSRASRRRRRYIS